jgi:hypothetical protein
MNLCKYKDILGKPGKGIHSYRIFNIAIADVIMTFIVAYIISYLFKFKFWNTLLTFFILGIILHRVFCVRTTVDKLLFPDFTKCAVMFCN